MNGVPLPHDSDERKNFDRQETFILGDPAACFDTPSRHTYDCRHDNPHQGFPEWKKIFAHILRNCGYLEDYDTIYLCPSFLTQGIWQSTKQAILDYPIGQLLLLSGKADCRWLSGLWGRFLAWPFSFLPVHLTRSHQDLGWLSCLRSPTFRHLYIVTRVSQDFTASVVHYYVIPCVIGASFSLIECASCHRYLEPNGFSAPILLSLCTIDDLTPERISRLWRTLPRRINLFSNLFD